MDIKTMPKIELHLHLDGSVRVETASELCKISLDEAKERMSVTKNCTDLNEYLTKFAFPISLLQTKENLKRISKELALDLRKENVIYAEIRFAPYFHTNEGLSYDEVIESINDGLNEVSSLKHNLILCMKREQTYEVNKKVIEIAKKFLNNGVCAVDLAGAEALYPTRSFKDLFEYAKELKVPFTIHAGEADGFESIEAALNFKVNRLGHGVHIIDSKELIRRAKKENVFFEVCPTSNQQTGVCNIFQDHPIKKMIEEELLVTVNTDNRTISNITLTKEYEKLVETFGFSMEQLIKINMNAIQASFLNEEEKDKLRDQYQEDINKMYK